MKIILSRSAQVQSLIKSCKTKGHHGQTVPLIARDLLLQTEQINKSDAHVYVMGPLRCLCGSQA